MAKEALPSPERLHQLFRVDFVAGKLFWRERPESDFATPGDCKTWHIRFANTQAFTCKNGCGYLSSRIGNVRPAAHKVIWCMKYGYWPKQIDHINGDRTDNRLSNLREVTTAENNRNRAIPVTNTSGVMGVVRRADTGKWRAYINADGHRKWLGTFATKTQAIAVRKRAEAAEGYHENHGRRA